MSELICLDCGNIFYDVEAVRVKEYMDGHLMGYRLHCPCCGSEEFEEANYCNKCGGAFLNDKLFGFGICEECVMEYMTTENLVRYAEDDFNAFAEWMEEDIKKAAARSGTSNDGKDEKETITQGE